MKGRMSMQMDQMNHGKHEAERIDVIFLATSRNAMDFQNNRNRKPPNRYYVPLR